MLIYAHIKLWRQILYFVNFYAAAILDAWKHTWQMALSDKIEVLLH